MEDILWAILSRAAENPRLASWIFSTVAVASVVRTLVLWKWPEFSSRPKWAHLVFIFADVLSLNVPKAFLLKMRGGPADPPLPPSWKPPEPKP